MANNPEKYTRRRLRSSYASVVISISLVLFVLGLFGLLLLNAESISKEVKENYAINLLLNDDASEVEVKQFQKSLDLSDYVKGSEYISKEEAAEELKSDLDEDFIAFLGYNPLLNSIELKLKADYVIPEKLKELEEEFTNNKLVKEVVYDKPLIQLMNDNIERIGLILIVGCILLSLIAIGLINSSIRLSIYSKRFLIKTMQLVGANKAFIQRPFVWKSFQHGLIGGIVSCSLIFGLLYYAVNNYPQIALINDSKLIAILFAGIILMGIFISMTCTFFALKKYLKLKTDQLYF